MKLHIDKEADALYLPFDDSTIVESEEVAPGVVLDYNESNQVVAIEMLYLSKRSPNLNLSTLELGSVDILGRLFRCQQELKACRPVRDVSRVNVEIDKTN